ncbi:MAG: GNAT family N-acetyltransferase [Geobacteraceae bacterium]|nr:GNAT family N-acetyltransferase [Geobacteraceae bacterium]
MEHDIQIRLARKDEAGEIVSLIRSSFSSELQNAMIYGCPGMERFIGQQIETPGGLADTIYLVAVAGELVVGCVELRWLPESLFLNYICTRPEARSKGLARRILAESIRIARRDHHREMLLDVFEDNLPARTWYERLGFRHDYSTQWWDCPLPASDLPVNGRISGYPQARASQEQYGFSLFKLVTTQREYAVGRLGSDWFRVTGAELLSDPQALALLQRIDGQRRILALIPEQDLPEAQHGEARRIVTSRRMSMDLDRLFEQLAD